MRSSPGHSGGETNQREQRRRKEKVQKAPGCCGSIQGAIAAKKSSKDGIEKQVYSFQQFNHILQLLHLFIGHLSSQEVGWHKINLITLSICIHIVAKTTKYCKFKCTGTNN